MWVLSRGVSTQKFYQDPELRSCYDTSLLLGVNSSAMFSLKLKDLQLELPCSFDPGAERHRRKPQAPGLLGENRRQTLGTPGLPGECCSSVGWQDWHLGSLDGESYVPFPTNKCLTGSNKKLLVTSALLLVTIRI